jgi:hypothetical protein
MKRLFTLLSISLLSFSMAKATIKLGEGDYTAILGGYIKSDNFFDTREVYDAREGHLLILPKPESKDAAGDDINERFRTNMLAIQTRLNLKITGPSLIGAKTFGFVEGEFFGTGDANGFRLRHAYVDINWGATSIRAGQTWHPLFDAEMVANTVSFNTGVPFQPFSRAPQIRVNQNLSESFSIFAALSSQRDFPSWGPSSSDPTSSATTTSSDFLRNSGVPDISAGLKYKDDHLSIAAIGDFKMLTPRTTYINPTDQKTYKSDEKISSVSADLYLKYVAGDFQFRAMGLYGQNLCDMLMMGGYAVKSVKSNGEFEYTTLNNMTAWAEFVYGKNVEAGLFLGYAKNLGSNDNTLAKYYTRSGLTTAESAFRVSPRVYFGFGSFKLGAEVEFTSAAYGKLDNKDKNKINDTKTVSNIRGLLSFIYNI